MSLEFTNDGVWVNPEPVPEADYFAVTFENGFLPQGEPIGDLPERYAALNDILTKMSVEMPDGSPGLLAKNEFRKTVKESFPNYLDLVKQETDSRLLYALHRDYTHMASAYTLEPCDLSFRATRSGRGGDYGKADAYLPASIAQPLDHLGNAVKSFPWLDYEVDYCLGNFTLADPAVGYVAPNLLLVRRMNGGINERGFGAVHLLMERHTGPLIKAGMQVFDAIAGVNHKDAQKALTAVYEAARDINAVRETMWRECKKETYLDLRTWIFGITGNNMFPKEGVHFEGCTPEWRSYRGETGAQSTIIPFLDVITGVNTGYPANELTKYLLELREYRAYHHRKFLQAVENRASKLEVLPFYESDPNTLVCWLRCLNEIRAFRQGHWNFTKQYIINNSDYPVATGGTPITTWLPNQLGATMELMQTAFDKLKEENWEDKITDELKQIYDDMLDGHDNLLKFLRSEVEKLREQFQQ